MNECIELARFRDSQTAPNNPLAVILPKFFNPYILCVYLLYYLFFLTFAIGMEPDTFGLHRPEQLPKAVVGNTAEKVEGNLQRPRKFPNHH